MLSFEIHWNKGTAKPSKETVIRFVLMLIGWLVLVPAGFAEVSPKYIFFNIAPERDFFYSAHAISNAFVDVPKTLRLPENRRLRVGVSFIFSTLETPEDALENGLRAVLAASERTKVPVLIAFDGQNWWENRPDLWNWWDPTKPGYNPSNVFNVEWIGWSPTNAIKISWRNWGTQCRVAPAQNFASPNVLPLHIQALQRLVPIIVQWHQHLPADRKWLLGGIKLGWEAGIGCNAYYYPNGNDLLPADGSHDPTNSLDFDKGLSGGLCQLGYAALTTSHIKERGEITPHDLGRVTAWYLEKLCRTAFDLGMPRKLIFTHQGGTGKPWEKHLPFWPAINQWSCPGWSFYGLAPDEAGPLGRELVKAGQTRWAACEWYWPSDTAEGWEEHFTRTLRFRDCRFVDVYNWYHAFNEDTAGQEAVRHLVSTW